MKNKLPQYLNDYFNNYLCTQKNLSTYTISSYKDVFNAYFEFCTKEKNIKVTNITLDTFIYENIIDFLNYLETSKKNCIATKRRRLFYPFMKSIKMAEKRTVIRARKAKGIL